MPSPFPGMDPYLEAPDIWPDLHHSLALGISRELNHSLPAPYYARLDIRPEVGIVEEGGGRSQVIPEHVLVSRSRRRDGPGEVPVPDGPREGISRSPELSVSIEPIRHQSVEIRDSMHGHRLVTWIEILSPSSKRPGPDHESYRRKQREVLDSDASLIEVDLLRSGDRVLPDLNLDALLFQLDPAPDYLALVNRAWQRTGGTGYQVFPVSLREWLPCIPVPLKQGEPEVPLDLQFVFNRAYDGGPYRRGAVDYTVPPRPPLSEADAAWAEGRFRDAGQRPPQ